MEKERMLAEAERFDLRHRAFSFPEENTSFLDLSKAEGSVRAADVEDSIH